MGVLYNSRIVTDGLALCLDAGDRMSYPGAGTTWYDLSKNKNNGTLTNGPTFTTENGGAIVFDGTDDYIAVADSSENFTFPNGNFSVGGWIGNVLSEGFVLTKGITSTGGGWTLSHTGNLIRWYRYYYDSSVLNQNVEYSHTLSDWVYLLATCGTSGAAGDMKIYVNGSLAATNSLAEIKTSVSNTSALEIGRLNIYGAFQTYGQNDSGPVHIYNKVLTADEVRQNYKATKGRFGL